ncbi:MAG: hypothetical protein E2O86_07965 [Bacteroidetes bacterium]|nr:MAG: hypothetical protein E2O86_07965 [Bacteroidota bacterium]
MEYRNKSIIKLEGGFSIELTDFVLEHRGSYEQLPLYEVTDGRIIAIAFVDNPAIRSNAVADDSENLIIGAVMIPDQKIFRNIGPNGTEACHWYFTAETIKKLKDTFDGTVKLGH